MRSHVAEKKKTPDGQILLDPQPDDSLNDPLNWAAWRRDSALLSLGFFCMLGGGMTPILAAGFNNVAKTFGVSYSRVALTTGLYMMGLGVGSVIMSPTAILFGKRPVYLFGATLFVLSAVWCAESTSFGSLAAARVFQGIAVSPVECLPSATIAEIFFLHERAFRIGIYTLLLLGGKNLIPLVSAAIIQSLNWQWVFWIVAIIAGFGGVLLFLFVPETFWDRTPRPKSRRPIVHRSLSEKLHHALHPTASNPEPRQSYQAAGAVAEASSPDVKKLHKNHHVGFAEPAPESTPDNGAAVDGPTESRKPPMRLSQLPTHEHLAPAQAITAQGVLPKTPHLHNLNSPWYHDLEHNEDYVAHRGTPEKNPTADLGPDNLRAEREEKVEAQDGIDMSAVASTPIDEEKAEPTITRSRSEESFQHPRLMRYTTHLRQAPPKTYGQTLKPWNGRLTKTSWLKVSIRPFILFTYPSVLWSALVYSLSVGWLIVLSESMTSIFRNKASYNFSALGTGLVYLSPFIGGILGTAVAGKVSDIIVRFMARRNGGVYEPEFRLVMAVPVAIATAIGLMGFGWSAQERDLWIVPTVFFGIISFGCSLGSTTAITFCVDSYRQYAGEALVTLNFSKNIFHGLVFSLFFPTWLEDDGPKEVFLAIGGIQIVCLLTTIPMYIYGKRARMETVRRNWMEKF